MKIIPDGDKPSVAIEIPLEKSLPDYDLEDLEHPLRATWMVYWSRRVSAI
jgi:hypothetical protein